MATSFTSLPVIDLSPLKQPDVDLASPSPGILSLANELNDVFATSGFAYLANLPLSFSHDDIFELSKQFFSIPEQEKLKLAKKTFVKKNENTYRGYFPTQPGKANDNLKEGFEIGSGKVKTSKTSSRNPGPFNMYEPNVWPSNSTNFPAASRRRLTQLYSGLQALSSQLLSLLALSLDKPADFFADWLDDSLSTLRLLHYPPVNLTPNSGIAHDDASSITSGSTHSIISTSDSSYPATVATNTEPKLSCTPHTDSGILTLLHQDPTGGLEVLNSSSQWIPAPYIPNTLVVNIGDLMAKVSAGRWVATMHRVRSPVLTGDRQQTDGGLHGPGFGRFSVPFFFEPGEECVVRNLEGTGETRYGVHVRAKMSTFVEFQGSDDGEEE